jgi:hypothetical protein
MSEVALVIKPLMDFYRDHPVKVEKKRVSIFKERKIREESRQKVERAVNQWLYSSLSRKK